MWMGETVNDFGKYSDAIVLSKQPFFFEVVQVYKSISSFLKKGLKNVYLVGGWTMAE